MAHEAALEAVALLALGVLSEREARDVAEHARDCPLCRAEYGELRTASDALGVLAVEDAKLDEHTSARMKANVMQAVRGGRDERPRAGRDERPRAGGTAATARPLVRARSPWLPYLAAAAAVVVAVVSSMNLASLRAQNDRNQQLIANLHADLVAQSRSAHRGAILEERLGELTAPDSKHFAVPAGEVITSAGHVYLALKVGELAPGKVYQAWTLRAGARTVAPSVTFAAESGVTLVELPESAAGLTAVAVSVEPAGGSKAPTSKPAFVRTLS